MRKSWSNIMRIIFLDFDGVIITWRSHFSRSNWNRKKWETLDLVCVNFLKNLCNMSDGPMRIVVSSSWRFQQENVMELLNPTRLSEYFHEDWRTTVYSNVERKVLVPESLARGGEINEWLNRHPEVKDYRILDDDSDILPKQLDRFIKCDGWDGLGGRDMKTLIDWSRGTKE